LPCDRQVSSEKTSAVAGSTIQEIEGLEFKALGEPTNADLKLDGK
jgi:hypothetical protein